MPIYPARITPNNSAQNPQYRARGITGITSTKIGQSGIFGFPLENQPAYGVYKSQISAFIYATAKNTKVTTSQGGYSFPMKPDVMIPFPALPPLHVRPQGRTNDAELTLFKERLQALTSYSEVTVGRNPVYVIDSPTPELVKELATFVDLKCPGPANSSNIAGYRGLMTWKKIVTAFLATHTYPAFQSDDSVSIYSQDIVMQLDSDPKTASNKKRALDIILEESKKRRKVGYTVTREPEEECGDMDVDEDKPLVEIASICPVAKPAPFRPSINFGPASYVPFMGGHLFPYFHDCLDNDNAHVPNVFRRFFFYSFGDTPLECSESFTTWRANIGSMIYTDAGSIVQHITMGIELALDTQSRLYLLSEGTTYHGFVLLGFKFAVNAYSKVHTSLSAEGLKSELNALSTHESSLRELCNLLSGMKIDGSDMDEVVNPDDIDCARALYNEMSRRIKKLTTKKIESFENALRGLSFKENYLRPNKDNIIRMLEVLNDPEFDFDGWPLFLHPDFIFGDDHYYKVLGSFGPTAPSFINIAGNRYTIPYSDAEDYATSSDPTKEDAVSSLLVSMKALNVAVGDARKMTKELAIYQNFQERAKANRNIIFSKGSGRDEIWNALKKEIAGTKPVETVGQGGSSDKPSKAKKRKIVDREADFDEF